MLIQIEKILTFLDKKMLTYEYKGNQEVCVSGFCSLNDLKSNCITWIKNKVAYNKCDLSNVENILIVIDNIPEANLFDENINLIICNNPKEVFFTILNEFFKQKEYNNYISPNSVVETNKIGKNVYIGHNSYIGENVEIGDNVVIKNNVAIEGKVSIGNNTVIHSGVVIGTDGFGYFKNSEGLNEKVPHYGGVVIGNDVEIGANTCIDRGTLDNTVIGDNVKIDNLCEIGHNVVIKFNTLIASKTNIGGSTIVKENCWLGSSSTMSNGLVIFENSHIGLGSVVVKDVPEKLKVFGNPARAYDINK